MTEPTSNGLSPEELQGLLDQAAAGSTSATFDQVFNRAQRARRNRWTAATAAVVVMAGAAIAVPLALADRGSSGGTNLAGPPPTQLTSGPDEATPGAALKLVNRWIVHAYRTTQGQLVLGDAVDGGLVLFKSCGQLEGNWSADGEGNFVAQLSGGDSSCFDRAADPTIVPWLDQASTFTVTDHGVELNDSSGKVVARLTPSHTLPPRSSTDSDGFRVAKVTTALRDRLSPAAPLPASLSPVDERSIIGWWRPVGSNLNPNAYLAFEPGGMASGSDGCNGAGGRYDVAGDGGLLAVTGPSTDVRCANSGAVDDFPLAARAGLDSSGRLTLTDRAGKVLGAFTRMATGNVRGALAYEGGPAPGFHPEPGRVVAHRGSATGPVAARSQTVDGHFEISLPAGSYVLVGPNLTVNGNACGRSQPVSVSVGRTVTADVGCEIM